MRAHSIFHGPVTNLLSILCILTEIFSRAHARSLNDLKFGTFIGCFGSDSAASRAVEGLKHAAPQAIYHYYFLRISTPYVNPLLNSATINPGKRDGNGHSSGAV